jgi:glycosyltransferase involved in cell wall biosynthesis
MIEVLHLIDTYRIGGPGKTIINSARYIDRARYRVHVGSFTSGDPERNEFARAVQAAGIPQLELKETRRFNPSHVAEVRRYLKAHRIALLHAHGYRTDVLGYAATLGTSTALVTTHHGWIRNTRSQRLFGRLARVLCERFDGVEIVSRRLGDELSPAFRQSARLAVVHNAIVLDDYRPRGDRDEMRRRLGILPSDRLIGVIGRLSREKGCLEMLDAFATIAARVPGAKLAFVGEGPLESELKRRVEQKGLQPRVQFVRHQTPILPIYEAVDVVVSPSHTEGLSNVILEALAVGRPVVATRVGGNEEIVEDATSALIVPPLQPDALAEAVCRVLQDDALSASLVAAGRLRVEQEFSFQARMRKEEAFYERILSSR